MYADKEHTATREIEDGFYTVLTESTYYVFRIHTHEMDARVKPGQQVIAKARNAKPRTFDNFGVIRDGHIHQFSRWKDKDLNAAILASATRLLDSDMEEAGKMYARNTHRCYVCNRMLTVADSLATGIGPDCAGTRKRRETDPQETLF